MKARVLSLLLSVLLGVSLLTAAPTASAATSTCAVPVGYQYNVPNGTRDQQYKWLDTLTCVIKAAYPGSNITISTYSWTHDASAQALIDADARGVNVRLVMWDLRQNAWTARFADEFNDGGTAGSTFKICKGACLGPTTGPEAPAVHHAKIYNFGRVESPGGGYVPRVVSLGTANPGNGSADLAWNNHRWIPDNQGLYDATNAYVLKMFNDKDQRTATAQKVTVGATDVLLFPQMGTSPDHQLELLRDVSCTGGTVVRLSVFHWTYSRIEIARRLGVLKKAGCDVQVIINMDINTLEQGILDELLRTKVPVYDAHQGGKHTHLKDLYVSGRINGTDRCVTDGGSANYTRGSKVSNDESKIVVWSCTVYNQQVTVWNLQKKASKQVVGPPSPADEDGNTVIVPDTNDPTLEEE